MGTEREQTPVLPSGLARRYVRYVVGFGIAVGIGLAPFLGKVAGLDALLDLFPHSLRGSLIPLSTFLMGLVAAAIQFYSGETLRPAVIRKRFGISLLLLLAGFALLFLFYTLYIEPVPIEGDRTVSVIIGPTRIRDESCGCAPADGTLQCLRKLSLSETAIETCWDPGSIRLRRFLLSLSYLMVMGGFGALIGLLLLQEEARKRRKRRPRKAAAPVPPSPAPPHGTS